MSNPEIRKIIIINYVFYTAELLVDTVRGLGAHSIHIGELKQLIGSLRTLENGKLVRNARHTC